MGIDGKAEDLRPSEASTNAGGAPEAGATPTQMQQGAGNPMAEPTGKETEGAKKDEGEAVLKKDPNDHSGEPMHMHNGSKPKNQAGGREGKTDNPDGQGHSNEEAGTGERWVKTTGLAAEGGDFDATKPGAGREADRLLEAKGIHKSEPGKPAESRHPDATAGTKERISIGDKIKNKLHIGSKDK
ncbi:hypothetical protein K432DRAFT_362904 [Lepidopterella palustris CBS 459.81]|uniref:Uncharacterized protein n=1 Tax=Lepidopterella palustris CBS 459.81 TaxID=1314670 RepID=A0A8E2E0I2_9PEZI|nr:hypothetical protein K432DRAFT_362904 [Lepidopterella palustris CBS 459.81]